MTNPGQIVEYEVTGELITLLGSLCVAREEAEGGASKGPKNWGALHRSLRDRWRSVNPNDPKGVAEVKADVVNLIRELS